MFSVQERQWRGKKKIHNFNDGCLIHGKSGTAVTVKHIPSFVGAIIPAS